MSYRDFSGIAVAGIAVALAAGSVAMDALAPPAWRAAGALDRASTWVLDSQPPGEAAIWQDGKSGMVGTIIPAETYRDSRGRWCRPYTVELPSGENFARIACRDNSGIWSGTRSDGFDKWLNRLTETSNQQIAGTPR